MTARTQAAWFGAANLAGAACLALLRDRLLPLILENGCRGLGGYLLYFTVAAVLAVCGLSLLVQKTMGAWVCFVVGVVTLCWISIGLVTGLAGASRAAHEPFSKHVIEAAFASLMPLQIVPGWRVLRARARESAAAIHGASGFQRHMERRHP